MLPDDVQYVDPHDLSAYFIPFFFFFKSVLTVRMINLFSEGPMKYHYFCC